MAYRKLSPIHRTASGVTTTKKLTYAIHNNAELLKIASDKMQLDVTTLPRNRG